jgi:tight adherence protein B
MCVALLLRLLTRSPMLALIVGAASMFLPYAFIRYAAAQRLRQFEEQFPEAIDLIARSLRAGHAFTTGLSLVAEEIEEPVKSEFRLLYDLQYYGMPLPNALKNFARRVPILDARFFVTAVLTQREAGGNLSEVLDNLAALIRERFKIKRQVRVVSAHGRITGWVLLCLPPTLAVVLSFIAPTHMRVLIEDPLGVQMAVGAVVLQIIGGLAIRRIVDVEF